MKTGVVLDRVDHSSTQVSFDGYDEGHVQPWMTAKLVKAINDAVFESCAEIGKYALANSEAWVYKSSLFSGLGPAYDRLDRTKFTCLCKAYEFDLIVEVEINSAHHRIDVGTIPLFEEENAMEKAKSRAGRYIINAAQDAMDIIIEKGDEEQKCRPSDDAHMEAWSTSNSPFALLSLLILCLFEGQN